MYIQYGGDQYKQYDRDQYKLDCGDQYVYPIWRRPVCISNMAVIFTNKDEIKPSCGKVYIDSRESN